MKSATFIRLQVSCLNVLGSSVVLPDIWKDRATITFKIQALQERSSNGVVEQELNPQHQTRRNIKSCGIYI
jgi:hypothetical protein